MKALIVEDEAIIALALRIELEQIGHECDIAGTGRKAIEHAEVFQPDIVLMDIHLAGAMDGIESARQIQAISDARIIFMTGYSDNELKIKAETLHPAGYLVKPVNLREIQDIMDS